MTYFWLAASVLLLALLYFWRRHSKQLRVPALFLWDVKEEQPNAGKSLRLMRLPLLFYLETLAILLLVIAAAMPFVLKRSEYPPLAVVLDNSFSMQAVNHKSLSIKELCIKDLERELSRFPGRKVHWVLAGSAPQKLDVGQGEVLSQWTCNAIGADIPSALQMARQSCPGGDILVLTDHKPSDKGMRDVHWISHGKPHANVGFVNVRRSGASVLLELFNSSDAPVVVVIHETANGGGIPPKTVTVSPKETRKIDFRLSNPDGEAKFVLETQNDALAFDNTAVLLPESRPPLAYRLADDLSELQGTLLRKTLMRNPEYVSVGEKELVVCGPSSQPGNYHRLVWHGSGRAVTASPITVRTDCPRLLHALSFADILWPADSSLDLPGNVLLYQGDSKLLSVERRGAYVDIHLNLHESGGNLSKQILWPAFFWNLSDYLRSLRHLPDRVNVRCGDMVTVPNPGKSRITADGVEVKSSYPQAYIVFDTPGLHAINEWRIAVNSCDKTETDLSGAASCDISSEVPSNTIAQSTSHQISFAFMLAALAVLALHWHLALRRR
ncbi:MAG: BatA and WFA domain-containing protein [Victivallales bacterium]|nr:BatA and WFA domain-containing protein [Victivallales bacterium]